MPEPHIGHKIFFALLSVVVVALVAFLTYQVLRLYQETGKEETVSTNETPAVADERTDTATVEDTELNTTDSTEESSELILGTVTAVQELSFTMTVEDQGAEYRELEVRLNASTTLQSQNTLPLADGTLAEAETITAKDFAVGDTVEVTTDSAVADDATSATATKVLRLY